MPGATWQLDQAALEAAIGYQFRSHALLRASVDSRAEGHGALETLGDAINDLAVLIAVTRNGGSMDHATSAVCNEALDEVYIAKLEGLARPGGGDNIETIVGAVHLDGGFNAAAAVGFRLCTDLEWQDLPDSPLPPEELDLMVAPRGPMTMQFGRLAMEAVVIQHRLNGAVPRWPTQRQLSNACFRHLSHSNLLQLGRAYYGSRSEAHRFRSRLRATIGNVLEDHGWTGATQATLALVLNASGAVSGS